MVEEIAKLIERAGELADLPLPVHPHMLHHSCGYDLAEQELPTLSLEPALAVKQLRR